MEVERLNRPGKASSRHSKIRPLDMIIVTDSHNPSARSSYMSVGVVVTAELLPGFWFGGEWFDLEQGVTFVLESITEYDCSRGHKRMPSRPRLSAQMRPLDAVAECALWCALQDNPLDGADQSASLAGFSVAFHESCRRGGDTTLWGRLRGGLARLARRARREGHTRSLSRVWDISEWEHCAELVDELYRATDATPRFLPARPVLATRY